MSTIGNVTNGALTYLPNGTVHDQNGVIVTGAGNISQFEPYQELWNSNPLQTYTNAANALVTKQQSP